MRAESYAGADYGIPCASDFGGSRGSCAFYTTGVRADCTLEQTTEFPVLRFWRQPWKLCLLHLQSARRSRFWISLCLGSWSQSWKFCLLHHRSACRVVLGSSSLMCQCPIKEKIAGKVKCTGKVFTVPHHRDDLACTLDTVGLHIKGLDKFNLPRR